MFSSPRPLLARSLSLGAASLGFITLIIILAPGVRAQSVSGLRAPEKPQVKNELPLQIRAARGDAPLIKLYEHLKVERAKIRRLPALRASEIQEEKPEKRRRIGTVRAFQRPIDISSDSALYRVTEGEVRVIGLVSAGALYTRVQFTNMSLPAGARVFVYSLDNPEEFYGPYEGRGPSGDGAFWTPPLEGEGIAIEYFDPTGTKVQAGEAPFQVSEMSHIYVNLFAKESSENAAGSCNLGVTGDWAEVAKSVGHLQFTSGGGEYLCTGTLLNNQANDLTPYLLTANHCLSNKSEAQSLRVYWNYNSGDFPPPGTPRTDGAYLLSTGTASDYTLVHLTGSLPPGLFFAGWDASPTALSTPVTGIHHPQGSFKRISFGGTDSGCSGGLPGPCQNFTTVRWNSGTTEPGSSGSGIWKGSPADARLIGTLTGGYASCNFLSGADYYGSFSVTYQNISSYLTGGGSGGGGNCTATPIIPNTGGVTGSLSRSDCHSPRRPGSFADQYSFNGSAGQKLEIRMTANFDTYIYLLGPGGTVIAANDDNPGLGGTNSLIGLNAVTLPSSGTYIIEATSYAPGAIGGYDLGFILQDGPTGPRFSQSTYSFDEGDGGATITVTRSFNTYSAETVRYYTADGSGLNECNKVTGNASSRCDYATSFGTLQFASGETAKTLRIPLVDDSLSEGSESFFIFLTSGGGGGTGPTPGGDLGRSTVTISDNDDLTGANPISQTPFFIRQHYVDFLGREPDPTGYAGWQDILRNCPAGETRCDRIEVSSAFFRSPEFQERGYFVYRFEAAILGRIPRYIDFNSSLARVSGFLSEEQLEAGKAAYAKEYLFNLDFMREYGGINEPRQFVERILTKAGVTLPNKEQLISDMATGKKTRDQVMRAIVDSPEVYQKFYNEAFVVMQYFGFLRRDPDILYLEWIKTMNETGDYRTMINGFMNSVEYRQRFGP